MFYVNSCSFVDYPNQILFFLNEEYRSILIMLRKIEDCLETLSILSVTFLLTILKDIARLYNSLLIIQESRYFEWLNCSSFHP